VTGRLTPAARGAGFDVVLENTSTAALEDVTIEYRAVDGHTRVQAVGGVRPGERKQIDPSPWRVEPGESFTVRARGREAVRFAVNPLPK
jgi:hypothetical protein